MERSRTIDSVLWVLTGLTAGLTVLLSLGPVAGLSDAFPGSDKVEHAAAYALTTFLFLLAAVWRPGRPSANHLDVVIGVAVIAIAGGVVMELAQGLLTAERKPELADVVAEAVGVAVAIVSHSLLRLVFRLKRPAGAPT